MAHELEMRIVLEIDEPLWRAAGEIIVDPHADRRTIGD